MIPVLFELGHDAIDLGAGRRPGRGSYTGARGAGGSMAQGARGPTPGPLKACQLEAKLLVSDHLQLRLLLKLTDLGLQGLERLGALVTAGQLLAQMVLGLRVLALEVRSASIRLAHLLQQKRFERAFVCISLGRGRLLFLALDALYFVFSFFLFCLLLDLFLSYVG